MKIRFLLILLLTTFSIGHAIAHHHFDFRSGEDEIFSGSTGNWFYIYDGPESPTILTITNGAKTGVLRVHDTSEVIVNGAIVGGDVFTFHDSVAYLNSGSYQNIYLANNSSIYFSGTSGGFIQTNQNSKLIKTGGSGISHLRAFDDSFMSVQGGSIFSYVSATGSSNVELYGGRFATNPTNGANVSASENSSIKIFGGSFPDKTNGPNGLKFRANQNALITFVGSNFSIGGQPIAGLLNLEALTESGAITKTINEDKVYFIGTLVGELESGNTINNEFIITRLLDSTEEANFYFYPESCLINDQVEESLSLCETNLTACSENSDLLTTQLGTASNEISVLTNENGLLQSELTTCQADKASLTSQVSNLSQNVSGLTNQLEAANNEISVLSTENENLRSLLLEPETAANESSSLLLRDYAQQAIDEAVSAGGDPATIEKAIKEITKANEDYDNGNYDKAINRYKNAANLAMNAI